MIRIYALAKELKIESKSLVEICEKAGLAGKGSALASLTEEEAAQVKAYLQTSPPTKTAKEIMADSGSLPMERPMAAISTGKIPVLKPSRPVRLPERPAKDAGPKEEPTPPVLVEEVAPEKTPDEVSVSAKESQAPLPPDEGTVATGDPAEQKSVEAIPSVTTTSVKIPTITGTESEKSAPKLPKSSPLKSLLHPKKKEEEPVPPVAPIEVVADSSKPEPSNPVPLKPPPSKPAPPPLSPLELAKRAAAMERASRPQVIGGGADGKKKKTTTDEIRPARGGRPNVGIHLAPLPATPEKPVRKILKEPTPQKPEIRLSRGVIREASEGKSAPLTDIMRQTEDRMKKGTKPGTTVPRGRPEIKIQPNEVYVGGDSADDGSGKKGKKGKGRRDDGAADTAGRKRRGGDTVRRADGDEVLERYHSRQYRKKGGKAAVSTVPRKGELVIEMPCSVKDFAEATGLSVVTVIKKGMELGTMLTINRQLDYEMTALLVEAFGLKAHVKKERTLEDTFVSAVLDQEDPPETLVARPPVVTFLGHVDHGKTSLLDRILNLDVVSGEKGGITQHIRSYRITTPHGDVTFVDTPGHEAFTEMRARGANCTDIAVLVVAADDGVMPQTEEAISHAKAAGVPIVVALNKMDLPGVNRDRVIQELAANDLMPSEWGGDVEIVETSATAGTGIDHLMETLLTVSELHELKARPDRAATGVAIEASLAPGQGVLCKALVQNGTLRPGDVILCGNAYGKIRAMFDTLDTKRELKEAGPSTPVTILGLDIAPPAGSKFVVLDDISVARQIAEERSAHLHERLLSGGTEHVTLETLKERLAGAKGPQTLNIIIRADVRGSIEAIRKELSKLDHPEVKVKILQASVGGITEADVLLADASDGIVVGFSVVPDERARQLAEQKKVQIRRYDIIYKLTEDIRASLEGMLRPLEQVKELGRALVQRTFVISRIGTIAGCRVLSGTMERDSRVRVIRDSRIIGEYTLDTLRREKDDAKEVREGYECGIKLKGYNDLKEGDIFEGYKIEEIARTF